MIEAICSFTCWSWACSFFFNLRCSCGKRQGLCLFPKIIIQLKTNSDGVACHRIARRFTHYNIPEVGNPNETSDTNDGLKDSCYLISLTEQRCWWKEGRKIDIILFNLQATSFQSVGLKQKSLSIILILYFRCQFRYTYWSRKRTVNVYRYTIFKWSAHIFIYRKIHVRIKLEDKRHWQNISELGFGDGQTPTIRVSQSQIAWWFVFTNTFAICLRFEVVAA